ncbi:MAG: hypothetical protein JXB62_05230 [Pirellulales bacterium]|nr:hypothetical protein [Pirellulales bacterium]
MSQSAFWAYIDPVSGSILLQVMIAAVIGSVAFCYRSIWGFVRFIFRRKIPSDDSSSREHLG